MRPDDPDAAYLWDMLDAARRIRRLTRGKAFADYQSNELFQLGIERLVEIIGEAASKVSEPFRLQHLDIPWRSMIGQRNVLAHGYADVDPVRIWPVVTDGVPVLITRLRPLIPSAHSKRSQK